MRRPLYLCLPPPLIHEECFTSHPDQKCITHLVDDNIDAIVLRLPMPLQLLPRQEQALERPPVE